jgi:hypothetical protein
MELGQISLSLAMKNEQNNETDHISLFVLIVTINSITIC